MNLILATKVTPNWLRKFGTKGVSRKVVPYEFKPNRTWLLEFNSHFDVYGEVLVMGCEDMLGPVPEGQGFKLSSFG